MMFSHKNKNKPDKENTLRGAEIEPQEIHLMEELGGGCFGKVWRGECFAKPVAVKVPHVQKLDKDQLESLRSEIHIMSTNPHPNIILFMGACTIPGKFQIVTELLDGDLEGLLHKQGKKMSLFERMCMAKDAALGLNWLHCSNPAIIHRDLKTANLLYKKTGKSYSIKVCDFGLSAIKPKKITKLRDNEEGAKGTPLYMAPEVMLGQEFNEKADVYSFGIVLWEIYTCKDPFPHHSDYDEFLNAICRKGERPPIPRDCLPSLRSLMEDCWHADPNKRPNFQEINDRLDEIIVHSAIREHEGRIFWSKYFLKEHTIKWERFEETFYKFLGLPVPQDNAPDPVAAYILPQDIKAAEKKILDREKESGEKVTVGDDVIAARCLRALVAEPESRGQVRSQVNIQWFGSVLDWFGPLERGAKGANILDNMRNICSNQWFHGDIEMNEAQRRLSGMPPGTFLVRFSTNAAYPGAFTITRVSEQMAIGNVRIRQHRNPTGFSVNDERIFESLEALVTELRDVLNLKAACGGSRFQSLFVDQQPMLGYEVMTG
ncbi:Dual specificity protein kinase [Balamuthia mandrillaris]